MDWYDVHLVVRPIRLGVKLVGAGNRAELPGRTSDVGTSIVFDINPFSFPADARHLNPIPRRLYIDAKGTFTPQLNFDSGLTSSLTAFSSVTRTITEYSILQSDRIKSITLSGNFASADQVLYDIELDLYVPSARRLAIG